MDMSQYRELFLTETREHITNLNKLVVTLEQQPDNRETIDALFREAHSIKGMAATMGFDSTAKLSHHLEDLLDDFRSTGEIPAPAVDYLLEGIDLLDGLLDDLQSDQPERDIDDFLRKTPEQQSIMVAEVLDEAPQEFLLAVDVDDGEVTFVEEAAEPDESATGTEELAETEDGAASEQEPIPEEPEAYQVMVELEEDTPAAAARGILILRALEKSGELMSSRPDIAALRGGGPCQQIQAWLRTSLDKGHIEEALLQISGVAKVRFIDDRRK
jgi:two-component system chemotaxis sensor kinase CheA